jgi:3,4-dihydroxy 2-butanone 4-phosphate synthase/GTP cyclohydrolase II
MFAQQHGINIISIAQIIEHRRTKEKLVKRIAEARLPTEYGDFHAVTYRSEGDPGGHLALTMGQWKHDEPVLVRMHSECLTGDVFKSTRCDCGDQMDMALKAIAHEGKGVFVYLRQEGRGIGLHNKIKAYSLQDEGLDTVDANKALGFAPDLRHYGIGAQILVDLDVKKLKLLTNNPKKVVGMSGWGLEIVERVPIQAPPTSENARYLEAKKSKLGHLIEAPGLQKRDT